MVLEQNVITVLAVKELRGNLKDSDDGVLS
jgi:hypothetical protein